ncbi:hypothetical protein OROMI_005103 [Orobanche minor]
MIPLRHFYFGIMGEKVTERVRRTNDVFSIWLLCSINEIFLGQDHWKNIKHIPVSDKGSPVTDIPTTKDGLIDWSKGMMDGLVLKHSIDGIEHLSFLSPAHMSPKETITLPFNDEDDQTEGNCCRGLFYLNNFDGKSVICNLTTKKLKQLTPPHAVHFHCDSGLGYDPISDDYKVIRNHKPASTAEVYSLKSDSWKLITGPGADVRMGPQCGLYLDGRCYWIRVTSNPHVGIRDFILSFYFTHETFSRFSLPPAVISCLEGFRASGYVGSSGVVHPCCPSFILHVASRTWEFPVELSPVASRALDLRILVSKGSTACNIPERIWGVTPALRLPRTPGSPPPPTRFQVDLFDCDGSLGVVGSKELEDHKGRVAKHFELWVCKCIGRGSWTRSFSVILLDVERPLGLRDGRFLFLEGNGKSSCGHGHLMVYDWVKEELREYDIYAIPPISLLLLSYAENSVVLPDAKPLINGEQEKVLKRCRHPEKVHNVEHSPEKVLKRCRHLEKVHVQNSPKKVLKKCRSRQEKMLDCPYYFGYSALIVGAGGTSNIFLNRLAENIQDAYAEAASIEEQGGCTDDKAWSRRGVVAERLLNQRRGVYVIGATNRPEVMDDAVLRPGRFGKLMYVPLPSPEELGMILKAIARKKPIDGDVDLVALAKESRCDNLSGADLSALMNKAVRAALEDKLSSMDRSCSIPWTIKETHFSTALEKISPSVSDKQIQYYKLLSKNVAAVKRRW